ncbi:hypothetical protein PIB30_084753 [Stylosanthes scabra]|uniref:Uncharacterized protein n=1 Tax=Stylosanthes scabra TaxID=79078 RepID=A0ABU6WR16_9FABA|nr:hypothetical protein [Stylosanthes scabra]
MLENPAWKQFDTIVRTPLSNLTNCSSSQYPNVRPSDQQNSSLDRMQSTERLLSVVHDVAQPTTVNNMEALIDYDPLVDYEGNVKNLV